MLDSHRPDHFHVAPPAAKHTSSQPTPRLALRRLGGAGGYRPVFELQAGQIQHGRRQVLQHQHDLKERRTAEVPLRGQFLHQLLKGYILVEIGSQTGMADSLQDLAEFGIAAEIDAEGEGVDEEADQSFQLAAIAVGDGGTDHDIGLAAVTGKENVESGQQDHEQGEAFAPCHGLEAGG